jgi:ankyrin repeat protein
MRYSSVTGKTTLLKYLLSKGANPNGLDDFEHTPLELCDSCAAIGVLIDHGADISRASLLHDAISISEDEVCIERMEFLLAKGVDINARAVYYLGDAEPGSRAYSYGMRRTGNEGTALHWAVCGQREVKSLPRVKWLLEKGADRDVKDNDELKPIDYAFD